MSIQNRMPTLTIAAPREPEPPFMSSEQEEKSLSLAQVFAIAWAHKTLSLVIAAVMIMLAAGAIKLLPKSYNAAATIIVNFEANDPLLGEQAFPVGYMDSYVATQIEVILSSSVLVPVVNELKLTENPEFMAGYNGVGSATDWAKAQLFKRLTINHPGGTQLIYISAEMGSAEQAAHIANTVAKVYLGQQEERLNTPATERADRYTGQLAELKENVAEAQQRVTDFRQRNGMTDVNPAGDDVELNLLNTMEQRYQDAINLERSQLVAQESQLDITRAAAQSGVVQALRGQLVALQTRMAEFQTTYGPNHPRVIELQSQMDSARKNLESEMQALGKASSIDLASARDLAAKLKPAVEAQRQKVLALRRKQDEGRKLILELESAQAVYRRALDGYDQVIAAAGGQASNLRLMNKAEVPVRSTKPNKLKLLIMAIGASLFFGFAGPFAYEFLFQRRVRCKDDVENDLRMPVLAEFGHSTTIAAGV